MRGAPHALHCADYNRDLVSHLDFAVCPGHPDLFRARFGGSAPVDRPADHFAHVREPPVGAGDAACRGGGGNFHTGQPEFELFICRIDCHHNIAFLCDLLPEGVGQLLSNLNFFREYVHYARGAK